MAAGKAILVIGIAVAIIILIGPLGTLSPINNFLNTLNPTGDTSDTGAGAETSEGDLSSRGSSLDSTGRASAKGSTDGDGKAREQVSEEGEESESEPDSGSEPDSDGDGLSDAEEDRLGTDRDSSDTDQDGVSDREETDRGTNPRDRNTDRDRQPDGTDKQPTTKNTAFVRVMTSRFSIEEDYTAMAAVILGPISGSPNPSTQVARISADIVFENIGDDFTSFVKFDSVFHVDGLEVKREHNDIGRLDIGQKITRHFTYTVKVSDIPPEVINRIVMHVVEGSHPVFSFEIKNVDFEKF